MNILEKWLCLKRPDRPLDKYKQFKIDFCCPNSGPWSCLHVVYRLRPIENMNEEIWLALPREDAIWNFMAHHHNMDATFMLPFPSSSFYIQELYYQPTKQKIKMHVFNSLT